MIRWAWPEAVRLERGVWLVDVLSSVAGCVGPWVLLRSDLFFRLTLPEIRAVAAHERGHRWHIRWPWLARWFPGWYRKLVRRQEFAADRCAAWHGHAAALVSALQKLDPDNQSSSGIYPLTSERVRRLHSYAPETGT